MNRFNVRVYYEDTDFSGNVYHAAYLKFCERARTEFLRERGLHHSVLVEDGLVFVVRHMDISFERPAHIDDELVVETSVLDARGARLVLDQNVLRGDELLLTAKVTVALVGPGGRPVRMPAELRQKF